MQIPSTQDPLKAQVCVGVGGTISAVPSRLEGFAEVSLVELRQKTLLNRICNPKLRYTVGLDALQASRTDTYRPEKMVYSTACFNTIHGGQYSNACSTSGSGDAISSCSEQSDLTPAEQLRTQRAVKSRKDDSAAPNCPTFSKQL